ncbi:proteasome-interacting protein cic1 [Didymosphaeria variabile]|uniref:Proteasome-interacting protein cic1 n=1 Tax=Didymosphaeria variabile TaxID=1932322 RepID=A0A9W9CB16_9PLEO|nr:proteasome-interacting protein cic1 [Didymosphaeria variabile]KAJ4354306.1 proteasome-interacting protein cic1 [Didymosphaeria variabile]
MAKSKAVAKSAPKKENALATKKSASPYQLDPAQVERAAKGLITHMKKHAQEKEDKADKKNLAADDDDAADQDQAIFLTVTTKEHVHDTSRLKPTKLPLPHSIIASDVRICIFTKDPQRAYKDLIYESSAFPAELRKKVARVIGVDKLKKKWKSFETKRQLLAEYDIFMVDDRVTKIVAEALGKTFYGTKSKRPIPIKLTAGAYIDKSKKEDKKKQENVVGTPAGVAKEIEAALSATYVSMSASTNTSIKVGKQSMTAQQLKENVEAVVEKLVEKHIEHKWRNVRGLYIKGPTTKALPIWSADEMWVDEEKVLDEAPTRAITEDSKKGEKRKKWEEWEEEMLDDEDLEEKRERRKAKKSKKDPEQTKSRSISKDKRNKLKQEALSSVQTPLITG